MATLNEGNGAVITKIGGADVSVARLKIRDYLSWLDELHKDRKAIFVKLIPPATPVVERYKILRNIELDEPSPDDIVPLLYTAAGQIRVIELALTKAMDKERAARAIDDLTPAESKRLAFEVSGLFTAEQLADIFVPRPPEPPKQPAAGVSTFGGGESPLPAAGAGNTFDG